MVYLGVRTQFMGLLYDSVASISRIVNKHHFMKLIEKKFLDDEEIKTILEIWNNEYPKTLNFSDSSGFDNYLNSLSEANHYVLKNENKEIQAWACKFERDSEKWFVVILDGKLHGKGRGTEILNLIKVNETNLNGWVIDKETFVKQNGEIYKSPLDFYLKNSFKVCQNIRIDNEKLSAVKITWEV